MTGARIPVVAVLGRPNVGKSTLFNRVLGRRKAIVDDTPGVTRDRHFARADWAGRDFFLVDTGGVVEGSDSPLDRAVRAQALAAVEEADLILLVVDAREGIHPLDERLAALLRPSERRSCWWRTRSTIFRARPPSRILGTRGGRARAGERNLGEGERRPAGPGARRSTRAGSGPGRARLGAGGGDRQAQRGQVQHRQPAFRRGAHGGERDGRHHARPGGFHDALPRPGSGLRGHGRTPPPGAHSRLHRVLRVAAGDARDPGGGCLPGGHGRLLRNPHAGREGRRGGVGRGLRGSSWS